MNVMQHFKDFIIYTVKPGFHMITRITAIAAIAAIAAQSLQSLRLLGPHGFQMIATITRKS